MKTCYNTLVAGQTEFNLAWHWLAKTKKGHLVSMSFSL